MEKENAYGDSSTVETKWDTLKDFERFEGGMNNAKEEEVRSNNYQPEGLNSVALENARGAVYESVDKYNPKTHFDEAIREYVNFRDSGRQTEPFRISREAIANDYFMHYPVKEEFSALDKLFKTKKYKKYLHNMEFANSNIDRVYNSINGGERAEVPQELANMMKVVMDDSDYVLATHLSSQIDGGRYENDNVLQNILNEGLSNLGDASSGHVYNDPPLHRTTTFCLDELGMFSQLTGRYKGSTGAIIMAFPKEYVNENGEIKAGMADKIYDHNELGNSIIKPKYILGFVQNLGPGTVCQFKSREELLNK